MKKLLIVLLGVIMLFAFTACGSTTEEPASDDNQAASSIDLGGGLGEYSLEGTSCGEYELIDNPEEFLYEGCEVTTYSDPDCNVPYIVVYRWAKGDQTLDEAAQEIADEYSGGYFQKITDPVFNQESTYITATDEFDGSFYYLGSHILVDGDDFVEIVFFNKTDEIQMGDTDVYAWIPSGYTDAIDQDAIDHGTIFEASYSEEYYLPYIWMGIYPEDNLYEYDTWYWRDIYPEGIPVTKEEYDKIISKEWNYDTSVEYYKLFGVDVVYSSLEDNSKLPYNGEIYSLSKDDNRYATEVYFEFDGIPFMVWFGSEYSDPVPAIAGPFLDSLHTK